MCPNEITCIFADFCLTAGMYICIATNDAGSSQANINLKVTYGNEF
jgi:hypothetical protein